MNKDRFIMKNAKGFTLIELLVVIAIISLLVSILLPSLHRAKELANDVLCKTNLKGMGLALQLYTFDHDGVYPYGIDAPPSAFEYPPPSNSTPIQCLLLPYANDAYDMFICPTDETPEDYMWIWFNRNGDFADIGSSYTYSEIAYYYWSSRKNRCLTEADIVDPSHFGYTADGLMSTIGTWWYLDPVNDQPFFDVWSYRIDWNHMGTSVNMLFGDYHVEGMEQAGISDNATTYPD